MKKFPRTKNKTELAVLEYWYNKGYSAIKNGWPDFIIYNDKELIFIEVKRDCNDKGLSYRQQNMAKLLKRVGIEVKVMRPKDCK